jgi:hypothetical protein
MIFQAMHPDGPCARVNGRAALGGEKAAEVFLQRHSVVLHCPPQRFGLHLRGRVPHFSDLVDCSHFVRQRLSFAFVCTDRFPAALLLGHDRRRVLAYPHFEAASYSARGEALLLCRCSRR